MPKISEKIAFHLPTGASMLRWGAKAPSPPLVPPLPVGTTAWRATDITFWSNNPRMIQSCFFLSIICHRESIGNFPIHFCLLMFAFYSSLPGLAKLCIVNCARAEKLSQSATEEEWNRNVMHSLTIVDAKCLNWYENIFHFAFLVSFYLLFYISKSIIFIF